ncbi:achaete-scute homolog 1-like [Neocloeon triangulifer]|uniref:achaete-scute homolog 1-like n=1 Tax=Neocloeon triangulifer TaxID=2078957 RepID=UPI00286EEF93|nr:achaete-scute homolog 1-like [Neocloeon triangulifer]
MSPPPVDYLKCLFPPCDDEQPTGAFPSDRNCRATTKQLPSSSRAVRGQRIKKGGYRHVPHKDKPPQMVARRNARERRRVQAVNTAFYRLRQAVPGDTAASRGKRVSKVKTLQRAIDYIYILQDMLESANETTAPTSQNYTPNSSLHDSLASDGASLSSGNVSSSTACCWGDCNNCSNCTNNMSAYATSQAVLIENYQY